MGRLRFCFEYISLNARPSSENPECSCCIKKSAEAERCRLFNGGEWSAMTGSPGERADSGDTDGAIECAVSGMGDRKGRL